MSRLVELDSCWQANVRGRFLLNCTYQYARILCRSGTKIVLKYVPEIDKKNCQSTVKKTPVPLRFNNLLATFLQSPFSVLPLRRTWGGSGQLSCRHAWPAFWFSRRGQASTTPTPPPKIVGSDCPVVALVGTTKQFNSYNLFPLRPQGKMTDTAFSNKLYR